MTARQVFEGVLTELSKVKAPSLLLHEFNYYFNKAINQYINKRYNIYDINQQTTDDIRVLKATAVIPIRSVDNTGLYSELANKGAGAAGLLDSTYEVTLPSDYLHLLNCICVFNLDKRWKCYNKGDDVMFAAKRLTADSWSQIINDFYNRPLPWNPYYYIHNINTSAQTPTNPITSDEYFTNTGTDSNSNYNASECIIPESTEETTSRITYVTKFYKHNFDKEHNVVTEGGEHPDFILETLQNNYPELEVISSKEIIQKEVTVKNNKVTVGPNLPRRIKLNGVSNDSLIEREAGTRYGNTSQVRMEIRCGRDKDVFKLTHVLVDYIKAPQEIRLTQEQIDLIEDTSQIMEFPDYVCQEIINELTILVMARDGDPRAQVQQVVTQSIAQPAQQQTQPQPQQRG